jgi:hypothetical protein
MSKIITIVVTVAILAFIVTRKDGIMHLLGFKEMTTVHSFETLSLDGTIRSKVVVRILGDHVHLDSERMTDHKKMSADMNEAEYGKIWDLAKDHIVPGTDHVDYE